MQIERTVELVAGPQEEKCRLDAYIARSCGLSRALLTGGKAEIFIDDQPAKKSTVVREGQQIRVVYTEMVFEDIEPQDIPLDIIYEDKDILVINKPQGLVVHPAPGNYDRTLVNALAFRYGTAFVDSMALDDDFSRPGIVHRLDKDTSGVMVVALNPQSHKSLGEQFALHTVRKTYFAIAKGVFSQTYGELRNNLGRDPKDRKKFAVTANGRFAHTIYQVEKQYPGYALCRVLILTGRTHQIRVHMSHIGHSILGDCIYSRPDRNFPDATLMLHAGKLELTHPVTGERLTFQSPLPERFTSVLTALDERLRV